VVAEEGEKEEEKKEEVEVAPFLNADLLIDY